MCCSSVVHTSVWGCLTLTTLTPKALPRFPKGLSPASSHVVVYTVMHTLYNPLSSPGFPGPNPPVSPWTPFYVPNSIKHSQESDHGLTRTSETHGCESPDKHAHKTARSPAERHHWASFLGEGSEGCPPWLLPMPPRIPQRIQVSMFAPTM